MALEGLIEFEDNRVARKATSAFYSGESVGNSYIWQPQTLCYTDVTTGKEVWVLTCTNNTDSECCHEYGVQPYSADGKRIAIALDKNTAAFTRGSFYANDIWMIAKSNGSYFRPIPGSASRIRTHSFYFNWSPVEVDTYFCMGRNYSGEGLAGLTGHLFKHAVTNTSVVRTDWIALASTERDIPKGAVTGDGRYIMATRSFEDDTITVAQIYPTANLTGPLTDYDMNRSVDPYWGNTAAGSSQDHWHDEFFAGNATIGYWIYFLYSYGSSPNICNTWWRMRPWGTDNAAPNHTIDQLSPYDWWVGTDAQKEIQPVNTRFGTAPFPSTFYWGHGVIDRWGTKVAFSDTESDYYSYTGPAAQNIETMIVTARGGPIGCQYHAWTGWTDYTAGTGRTLGGVHHIYRLKYDAGNAEDNAKQIAYTHIQGTSNDFTCPGQSPDGTKTVYRSDFLNPTAQRGDIFFVVAEYPHPLEIVSCAATGGTITVRGNWRLDQVISRGYTQRGWPRESEDNPPPPREIEKFRLWRSANGTTWTPVTATTDHEIFTRYDFSDGTWDGDDYWELTDTPGDGTWYYATTSIEHSGLESKCLSNIFSITVSSGSGTGSEDTAYPAIPGAVDAFYDTLPEAPSNLSVTEDYLTVAGHNQLTWTEPDDSMIRYYNVYYSESSTPTIAQANRIASLPVGTTAWVDWLARPAATNHYYVITSVDGLGNESGDLLPAPSDINCEGETAPTNVTDITPEFRAYCDPDGTNITKIQVQVSETDDFSGALAYDSGMTELSAPLTSEGWTEEIEYGT